MQSSQWEGELKSKVSGVSTNCPLSLWERARVRELGLI